MLVVVAVLTSPVTGSQQFLQWNNSLPLKFGFLVYFALFFLIDVVALVSVLDSAATAEGCD